MGKSRHQRGKGFPSGKGLSRNDIKVKLLTRKNPSAASGIIDAPVIKDGDIFLLTKQDGQIPFEGNHGFGLYHHDCRYLNGYRIEVNGASLEALSSTTQDGYQSVFQLTNPPLRGKTGRIHEHSLGLRLTHLLSHRESSMRDILEIRNFGPEPVALDIRIFLRAQFEDVFNIRGLDERQSRPCGPPGMVGAHAQFPLPGLRWVGADAFRPVPGLGAQRERRGSPTRLGDHAGRERAAGMGVPGP